MSAQGEEPKTPPPRLRSISEMEALVTGEKHRGELKKEAVVYLLSGEKVAIPADVRTTPSLRLFLAQKFTGD